MVRASDRALEADSNSTEAWMARSVVLRELDRTTNHDRLDALRRAHRRGARVASICTGAFILAAAGLLDGRRATTHWAHTEELSRRYPHVQVDANVLYVDDGDIMTSAGRAAGLDLCLHIVRSDHGAEIANHVARRLVTGRDCLL